MVARRKFVTALFGAVATLLLAGPWDVGVSGPSSEAAAAPGGSGQGSKGNKGNSGGGKSGNGNSGKGNSGGRSGGKGRGGETGPGDKGNKGNSGGGKSGNGNSGKGNSGSRSGGKGRGGETRAGGNSGAAKSGKAQPGVKSGDGFGQRGNEHINPVTGTKVEINGSNVEVVHVDGIREEITGGRYRMNDAQGRTIIERTATESDRARFRAMILPYRRMR